MPDPIDRSFPPGFLWGAATSAYQIEGAVEVDGRGESIWDRFAARPGNIVDASDGRVACAHFHRWREDIGLLRQLRVGSYRFSIAWPRIFPGGRGRTPGRGLDFYDRLVDALLENEIAPMATLYHWDLPQALEDTGGWPDRDIVTAFADYVDAVTRRLGDRITHYITLNEPWIFAFLGYLEGVHAPGRRNLPDSLAAAHHALLAHGTAVEVVRGNAPGAKVGITLNLVPSYAASDSDADVAAARRFDGLFNRWFLDPLYGRGYPDDVVADYRKQLDGADPLAAVQAGDLDKVARPTDFLGVNYYSRHIARSTIVSTAENAPRRIAEPTPDVLSEMGWEDFPNGLQDTLTRVQRDYAPSAVYVTENGAAMPDVPAESGEVDDRRRVRYLAGHLDACRQAIEQGVPLHGYAVWSLLDNFEWALGYTKRFGLHYVDYETQERRAKRSARWYRDVVARNGLEPEDRG